ncbi:ADP-ribosylation_factor [Hexamita inflata]|uniref:ADP-ribosylation factor n=1 Tax=Hexamita inflata TaxID=28002 RepID=A0AA86UUU2_9EUKA|nr:ADP-ribosylation factor [Hexamita inflata]
MNCCKADRNSQTNVLMLSLGDAGKTQLLYSWSNHKFIETTPTIAFNVETIYHQNQRIAIWDIGGQVMIRKYWHHYFQNMKAIFFVIDSTQRDFKFIQEAKSVLLNLLNNQILAKVPFLILFNKTDLNNSFTDEEILEEFYLSFDQEQISAQYAHQVKVMRSSALQRDYIEEILSWVMEDKIEEPKMKTVESQQSQYFQDILLD